MLVDANVILRIILLDNDKLVRRALLILNTASEQTLILSPVVAAEIVYVLTGHGYDRSQSAQAILLVLEREVFGEHKLLKTVLGYYAAINLDFADCYLLARALREHKTLKTLDLSLQKAYKRALSKQA